MKTRRNILIAFLLNLLFSILEAFGGFFTGSVAILSDSLHDMGDAVSIGFSWFLEKKSTKAANDKYTFGYRRYSLLGAFITVAILVVGAAVVIYGAVRRIMSPVEINRNGMLWFAVAGIIINLIAAFVTREGDSVNQKAVNLHMMEDVLTWGAVLAGAIIIRFTGWSIVDPILSILISLYILHEAAETGSEVLNVFLMKTPEKVELDALRNRIADIPNVENVNGIRVFSIDGEENYADVKIAVKQGFAAEDTKMIRAILAEYDITASSIELA